MNSKESFLSVAMTLVGGTANLVRLADGKRVKVGISDFKIYVEDGLFLLSSWTGIENKDGSFTEEKVAGVALYYLGQVRHWKEVEHCGPKKYRVGSSGNYPSVFLEGKRGKLPVTFATGCGLSGTSS